MRYIYEIQTESKTKGSVESYYEKAEIAFIVFDMMNPEHFTRIRIRELSILEGMKLYKEYH